MYRHAERASRRKRWNEAGNSWEEKWIGLQVVGFYIQVSLVNCNIEP
jgi:hypothetical protein